MTSMQVEAAAPVADKQAPSFYRYKVGDAVVTVVSDGKNVFPLTDSFITNAKKEDVAAELEKNFMPPGMMAIYFAPLVIQTGGKTVVIDTGTGQVSKTNSKGNNGLFHDNLLYLSGVVVVVLGLSFIAERLVERPGNAFGHRLSRRLSTRASAVAQAAWFVTTVTA